LKAFSPALLLWLVFSTVGEVPAQWQPPPELQKIPVRQDCKKTQMAIGLSTQPSVLYPDGIIFLCPSRAQAIDRQRPGASFFFRVHEYGHLALHTRSEEAADDWAAEQLSATAAGREVIKAVVLHFIDEAARFDPRYGTGLDRALRVLLAGKIPRQDWPKRVVDHEIALKSAVRQGRVVRLHLQPGYANSAEMILLLDHQPVGFLSNRPGLESLVIPPLNSGHHEIDLSDVWLYHSQPDGTRLEVARSLSAETEFDSAGTCSLDLQLDFDGQSLAAKASMH
jgi:hypothetical protein